MCSIKEEDLTSSVDFELYDPGSGGHKEENVIFNKVYDKPPSGRHRSISTPNKVCYENSVYNGTNKSNDQQQQSLDELELNNGKKNSVLLMNGTRKNSHTTTTNNVEKDNDRVVLFFSEENDFQSGLDVSISDDTDDDGDDNNDLLVDEITDDEDVQKEQSLQDVESLNYSRSESKTNDLETRSLKSDTLHRIGVPSLHNRFHQQYGSVSCSSESSFSVNNDSNESDLSSLDDDDDDNEEDDDDEDEDCCSDEDDEDADSSTNNDAVVGSMLGKKHKPTHPRKILSRNEISFAERYSLHKLNQNDQSDMNCNCNNIEDEDSCSSASEMTDVSPLASSADNSPTIIRKSKVKPLTTTTTTTTTTKDTIISVCKKSSSSPTLNGKNGFSRKIRKASDYSDMDMNVIMQAVEEISKEDEEKWKRCNSKISTSLSPTRKRNNNNKTNITYPKERARQIEKENERLLSQLLELSSSKSYKVGYKVPLKPKVSHSAINRQREQRRIAKENEAFLRRLQFAKASHGLSRDEQLEEYNSKHVKYPRNKSTYNNGSPFKRPFTASSSSSRNSIISLTTTDTNSIPLSKTTVYHQSTPAINNRPEWVSKW